MNPASSSFERWITRLTAVTRVIHLSKLELAGFIGWRC